MMGAILAYFGSKMYLLLMGADLNTQFKIVYADGTKVGDKSETNASDLRSATENDVNNNIKVRVILTLIRNWPNPNSPWPTPPHELDSWRRAEGLQRQGDTRKRHGM